MHLIYRSSEVKEKVEARAISSALGKYLENKLLVLQNRLAEESGQKVFSLKEHGPIVIIENDADDLERIGLSNDLSLIMPEWIGQLRLGKELYYVTYVLANNDYMLQIYLPELVMHDCIRKWLAQQPLEKEGDSDAGSSEEPF